MPRYAEQIKQYPSYSIDYALNYIIYLYVKSNFYQHIVTVSNPNDYLVLVNKNYRLPEYYKPDDLVYLDVSLLNNNSSNEANYLRKEAAIALKELFSKETEEGYKLITRSRFRSYETQFHLYNKYVCTNGKVYADSLVLAHDIVNIKLD